MAISPETYVDTSALIAFADRSDTYHPLFRRLFADPPRLLTTSLVIAEGHAWFLRRYDATRGLQFMAMTGEMPFLSVAAVGQPEVDGATALLRRYADQSLTLTDAVGLFLMRQRRMRACWSNDRHLGLTGVPLVIDG
jgi:predicted nucleic acid-binding protein